MKTRAVKDGDEWVINGRKIWISTPAKADFTIVMAVTDSEKRARGGITAFMVDKGTPGFIVARDIPMIGGAYTYEIVFEDCRVPRAEAARRDRQGLRADAAAAAHPPARDGVELHRHGPARAAT